MSAKQDILDIAEQVIDGASRHTITLALRAVVESLTVPEDGANKHAAESAKNAHDQSIRLGTVDAVLDLGRESAISWQAFRYIEYQAKQIDAHKERAIAAESKLSTLTERCEALEKVVRRLSSMEAFTGSRAVTDHPADKELLTRIEFAEAALAEKSNG